MKRILMHLARYLGLYRHIGAKHFGKYRGEVIDNNDPQKLGRLKLRIPSVLGGQITDWALPCLPYVDDPHQGMFIIPEVNAQIWVEFEEGNILSPIWVGSTRALLSSSPEYTCKDKLSKCCQFVQCEDAVGKEFIRLHHPTNSEMVLEPNGSISLKDASGAVLIMNAETNEIIVEDSNSNVLTMNSSGAKVEDSNGNVIEMASDGVTVEGSKIVIKSSEVHLGDTGGEPIIKGESFLEMFSTHIHTSAPVVGGPSSPPIPQGEASTLSTTVKTI